MGTIFTYTAVFSSAAVFFSISKLIYTFVLASLKKRRFLQNITISSPEVTEDRSVRVKFILKDLNLKYKERLSEIADLDLVKQTFKKENPGIEIQVEKLGLSERENYKYLKV